MPRIGRFILASAWVDAITTWPFYDYVSLREADSTQTVHDETGSL
jgi:hypothetical protein